MMSGSCRKTVAFSFVFIFCCIAPIIDELNLVYEVLCAGRVLTAWKVWRTWSNGGGETGLRFDDSNVQTKLAAGLVDREKVSLLTSLFVASLVKQAKVIL